MPDPERDHIQGAIDARLRYWSMEITNASFAGVQPMRREIQRRSGTVFVRIPPFSGDKRPSHAEHAAEAAEGAGEQGAFWPMHENAVRHQAGSTDESLAEYQPRWASRNV